MTKPTGAKCWIVGSNGVITDDEAVARLWQRNLAPVTEGVFLTLKELEERDRENQRVGFEAGQNRTDGEPTATFEDWKKRDAQQSTNSTDIE